MFSRVLKIFLYCSLSFVVFLAILSFVLTGGTFQKPSDSLLVAFAKHPYWSAQPIKAAPIDIGFATADFQDNGPKWHPLSNWGAFYQKNAEKLGNLGQVPDIWNHPEKVIERLNDLGCKKFRFSISRDKLEPQLGAPFDPHVVAHYREFCRALKSQGIEPMATLHHFSDPLYFSWERKEDIEGFVRYAEQASEFLYEEGVRKIITINEPTVLAFQGWVMGAFPPHRTMDFKKVGIVLEHMMRAHTQTYEALKARHPDFEIGLSHDPIRFRHFHKMHPLWAPMEKIICHYLTEMNHSALMRFLETGKFSLNIPFSANHTFALPTKPPLDFIGLQYYTDPLLKLSFGKGESVTRELDEKLTSYQYRMYPQGLASILEEMRSLGVPIDLTEIGIDTGINKDLEDKERICYFEKIFQVIQKAKDNGVPIRSLYFWTLIDNLEWYKSWDVRFGFYQFNQETAEITPRPVALWLKDKIKERDSL